MQEEILQKKKRNAHLFVANPENTLLNCEMVYVDNDKKTVDLF